MNDPLAGSAWSRPETVRGFVTSPPNPDLLQFASHLLPRSETRRAIDVGCGAGRNAIPLAADGWTVIGTDLSVPMLQAAAERARDARLENRVQVVLAPMERLPLRDASCALVIAHGIWNLARSGEQFRAAVREAARIAAPDAGLFVFTFSRHTLPPDTSPVAGESFVFTQFSGDPQCFLTEAQLRSEVQDAGFLVDPALPLQEFNRPPAGFRVGGGPPVIYQAAFRRAS
jgi:ubiquinone/menaquinone biosynthesis C-methylase UbiE